jgi:oxygen tolerance protein BatD
MRFIALLVLASLLALAGCQRDRESESRPSDEASPPAPGTAVQARLLSGDPVVVNVTTDRSRVIRLEPFTLHLTLHVRDLPLPWRGSDPFSLQTRGTEPVLTIPWLVPPPGLESRDGGEWLQQYLSFVPRPHGAGFLGFRVRAGDRPVHSHELIQLLSCDTTFRPEPTWVGAHAVFRLARTFRPVQSGRYEFAPVQFQGDFAVSEGGREPRLVPVDVRGPGVVVQVEEPPEAGRPDTWSGGIDLAGIAARATPTQLAEGEPLILSLIIEGEAGALQAASAVHLAAQAQVFRDFQVVRDDPMGRLQPGKKVFDYVIRPRRAGIDRIPPLGVATFDSARACYRTLRTEPIPLTVTAVEDRDPGQPTPIQGPGGLHPNHTDPSDLADQAIHPVRWWLAVSGLALLYVVVRVAWWGGRRFGVRPGRARRHRLANVRADLARARAAGDSNVVVGAVRHALGEAEAVLAEHRNAGLRGESAAGAEMSGRIAALRDRADAAAFAGGRLSAADVAPLLDEAESFVAQLIHGHRGG